MSVERFYTSIRTDPKKQLVKFAITVSYCRQTKEHVFDSLKDFCEDLVVSEERHQNGTLHHHLYTRLIQKALPKNMDTVIRAIYGIPNENQNNNDNNNNRDTNKIIHISSVRNLSQYLRYITKEDTRPLFKGFQIEKYFSFYYRSLEWAKRTQKFDVNDPYVMGHPQYYKLLREFHTSVSKNLKRKVKKRLQTVPEGFVTLQSLEFNQNRLRNRQYQHDNRARANVFSDVQEAEDENEDPQWREKVVNWYNDFVGGPYRHKKPQLYLWGPSGRGKTVFINNLLQQSIDGQPLASPNTNNIIPNTLDLLENIHQIDENENERNHDHEAVDAHVDVDGEDDDDEEEEEDDEDDYERQIFRPTPNDMKYAWQAYDKSSHNICVIDEFSMSQYNVNDFKKAIAGETLVANGKNITPRKIKLKMPVIIISNHPPPTRRDSEQYIGIFERLHVINTEQF